MSDLETSKTKGKINGAEALCATGRNSTNATAKMEVLFF